MSEDTRSFYEFDLQTSQGPNDGGTFHMATKNGQDIIASLTPCTTILISSAYSLNFVFIGIRKSDFLDTF